MQNYFIYDDRLGISIPSLEMNWEEYNEEAQQQILFTWEKIRGHIPDRIAEIEVIINKKQDELGNEMNFIRSCELNSEISEHASIINDLWLWYRMNQSVSEKVHQ